MPLWGYTYRRLGTSYLVPTDIGTRLALASTDGRLRTTAIHDFSAHEGTLGYTVAFALTDGSAIGAARDYRRWLLEHHQLRTLREKATQAPQLHRLRDAFHAYLWGSGRTAAAIRDLDAAGVERMLLSWDADGDPMPKGAATAAKKAGYLVGPYDTWANAQPPETADAPTSVWPAPVWDEAYIRDADGTIVSGFQGRGCYLSSQALA